MIEAHRFNPSTNEYEGTFRVARRRLSREEPDRLLLIGPYTLTPPPKIRRQYRTPVWDRRSSTWSVVSDYRTVRVWSKTTNERVDLALGDELGEDLTVERPSATIATDEE